MAQVKRKEDYGEIIEYLFHQGYQYDEIKGFLAREHGIEMSIRTLKRRATQRHEFIEKRH